MTNRKRTRGNGEGSIFKLSGKRKKPYAVRITIGWDSNGKQIYKYLGYYEKITDAKKALAEYQAAPEKINIEKKTLKNIFDAMLEKAKFSEGTIQQYISGFKQLEILHNRTIDSIKLDELEDILKGKKPSTQLRMRKALANCYKYAMRYDYVTKNLAHFLEVDDEETKEKIPFTVDEINELWENLGSDVHDDIPLILLYTGMRISELLWIENKNVDLDNQTIFIAKSKGKTNGIRTIPIHHEIFHLVKRRYNVKNKFLITSNGKQLNYSTFQGSYWNNDKHTIHETRHTFVTHITKCSNDQIAIKKIIGHSLGDITGRYTHRSIEDLKAVMNTLQYKK